MAEEKVEEKVEEKIESLDDLIIKSKMVKEAEYTEHAKQLIKTFAEEVEAKNFENLENAITLVPLLLKRCRDLDLLLSEQVNEIIHHPDFQKLEASWLGLHKFICNIETRPDLNVRIIPVKKEELLKDIEGAIEFDQSSLFKKIYEEEYGTFGGSPFSVLIGDYYFNKSLQDINLLEGISNVAAAAHTPFIAAASPLLFGMEKFEEIPNPIDLVSLFQSGDFLPWNSFRMKEDSKYIVLTLPRVIQRIPYGKKYQQVEEFDFEEQMNSGNHDCYLWGNPAYVLGNRITSAFQSYGWCAAIRGVEGGGLVDNLPVHVYQSPSGDQEIKCPSEIIITDRREKELSDLGFIALCYRKNTNQSVFFGSQTVAKSKVYDDPLANENAFIALQLPYLLAASRFAHYIKVIMRDKIGSFATSGEVSNFLNNWIARYVLTDDFATHSVKASYPLREARIDVYEVRGMVGVYKAVCYLRPHFQLNELTVSIRLVSELPAAVGA
ncbi:type VI secretion system contractile sheath large subunit [Pigmentibacter ruber]